MAKVIPVLRCGKLTAAKVETAVRSNVSEFVRPSSAPVKRRQGETRRENAGPKENCRTEQRTKNYTKVSKILIIGKTGGQKIVFPVFCQLFFVLKL